MLVKPVALAILGSLTVAALLFLTNFSLTFVTREHYRRVAVEAFRSGGLPRVTPVSSPVSAPHYHRNDCIILGMLIADRSGENRVQQAVSPKMVLGPGTLGHPGCEDTVYATTYGASNASHYHNYLHAYWTLAGALLLLTSFVGATTLLWGVGLALCISVLVFNAVAFARTRNPRRAAFASLGLGAVLFTGRDTLGWSMSYAPSDIAIFSFLLAWSIGRGPGLVGAAFLGAITAAFEFLTGALPVAAALILTSCAFHEEEGREKRAVETLTVFSLAFIFMFALKAVAVTLAFGAVAAISATAKLLSWTSTDMWQIDPVNSAKLSAYGLSTSFLKENRFVAFTFALAKMAYFSPSLIFGSFAGGLTVTVLLPAGLVGFGVLQVIKGDRRYWLVLAGVAVIMGWYFVMLSHTIVHANFMVRTLSWLGCIALAVFAWSAASRIGANSVGQKASSLGNVTT